MNSIEIIISGNGNIINCNNLLEVFANPKNKEINNFNKHRDEKLCENKDHLNKVPFISDPVTNAVVSPIQQRHKLLKIIVSGDNNKINLSKNQFKQGASEILKFYNGEDLDTTTGKEQNTELEEKSTVFHV